MSANDGTYEAGVRCLGVNRNFQRLQDLSVNSVINLVFQDESSPYGAGGGAQPPSIPNNNYLNDVAFTRLSQTLPYSVSGVIFRINTGPNAFPDFRTLVQWTFIDNGLYTPPSNLSDYGDVYGYQLDVTAGATSQYYLTQIVSALNSLGINLNC